VIGPNRMVNAGEFAQACPAFSRTLFDMGELRGAGWGSRSFGYLRLSRFMNRDNLTLS
jgi:hypothetical protein